VVNGSNGASESRGAPRSESRARRKHNVAQARAAARAGRTERLARRTEPRKYTVGTWVGARVGGGVTERPARRTEPRKLVGNLPPRPRVSPVGAVGAVGARGGGGGVRGGKCGRTREKTTSVTSSPRSPSPAVSLAKLGTASVRCAQAVNRSSDNAGPAMAQRAPRAPLGAHSRSRSYAPAGVRGCARRRCPRTGPRAALARWARCRRRPPARGRLTIRAASAGR
jgi:hypothetical protein